MNSPRTTVQFAAKQCKTLLHARMYGYTDASIVKPVKTAQQLANERRYLAEHIRANSLPTTVGRTSALLTDDGEPDVYAMLTEFLFIEGLLGRSGDAEFFPTYVIAHGRIIPYDLENPGKRNETLLVWI
jgi:hypothetical protein